MTYSNIRTLILDIHSDYTASKVVVYKNTVDITALQFRLVDGNYYYTLPENSQVMVFIDNVRVDSTRVNILDRFKGLFQFILDESLFNNGENKQYEITIAIYGADTDCASAESFLKELKTSIMYSSGSDDFEQAVLDDICPGTTTPKPTHPNPHFGFDEVEDDAILDSTVTIEYV